jgi:hypothetical protein
MATKAFSLADLNLQKKCQEAVDFKPLTPSGKELGITLKVLGGHAPAVQDWVNKALNDRRRAEAINAKRGRNSDIRSIEDDIDFGIEVIAIRIVGWEGITEPWSPENALLLCRTNPEILSQVREFSEEIANFTKG